MVYNYRLSPNNNNNILVILLDIYLDITWHLNWGNLQCKW